MEFYLIYLIVVKVIFLISLILTWAGVLAKHSPIETFTHTLFFVSFAGYMMYVFRPTTKTVGVHVDGEFHIFLFIFAILVLLDIDWKQWGMSVYKMVDNAKHHTFGKSMVDNMTCDKTK